jgi:hypothetical protein
VQLVAFVVFQVTVELSPLVMAAGATLNRTVGAVDAATVAVADSATWPPAPVHVNV